MPRISRTLIAERETFTNQNFAKGMTIAEAQAALVEKYQMKMAPPRLKELFDAVWSSVITVSTKITSDTTITAEVTVPAATFPNKPVVPVADATFAGPFVRPSAPAELKPLTFTRVYEPTQISKGGGPLLKAGELAKAIEEGDYKIE